jgi:TonB family protein
MQISRTTFLLAALLTAAWSSGPHAQGRSVTMGSLVMMRAEGDPGATEAIGAALSHPESGIRAVAARLVAVGRLTALRLPLSAALRSEKNEAVAAEQARAYMLLGGTHGTEELDAYLAVGAPPTVSVAYGLELARHAPQLFIDRLPRLLTALGQNRAADLAPAIGLLGSQHPTHAESAWRGWLTHAPSGAWSSVLSRYRPLPSEAVLLDAVTSDDAAVREATVWFVATWVADGVAVPAAVVEAMRDRPGVSEWEAFGRELVARKLQAGPRTDRSALVAAQPAATRKDLQAIDRSDLLLRTEQRAIDTILGERPARPSGPMPVPDELPLARTPENLWPGFFTSLAAATGCRPGAWDFGVVRMTYALDGRPMTLAVDRGDLSEACVRFAITLGHVTLIDPVTPLKSGGTQWLVVPASRNFVGCADAPRPDLGLPKLVADQAASTSRIQDPNKVHHVRPTYPRDALARGVSGAVVLEAVITRGGCVGSAFTVRSIDPFLDIEALRTVLQWRYTPAKLNGVPVDVVMTATVNFQLN